MWRATAALLCLLVFQISPIQAQENAATVDWCKASPTAVRTWEKFEFTCAVRHLDLSGTGEELRVLEDKLEPGNLSFGPFESAGDIEIEKSVMNNPRGRNEMIKYYTWPLRIIQKNKTFSVRERYGQTRITMDTLYVPPITVQWFVKRPGQDEEDATVFSARSDSTPVKYMSSIPSTDQLDVRENFDFDKSNFVTWFLYILSALLPLGLLVYFLFARRSVQLRYAKAQADTEEDTSVSEGRRRLEPASARGLLVSGAESLESAIVGFKDGDLTVDNLERSYSEFRENIRELLLAESEVLMWGHGYEDMVSEMESMSDSKRKEALMELVDLFGADFSEAPEVLAERASKAKLNVRTLKFAPVLEVFSDLKGLISSPFGSFGESNS